MGVYAQVSEYSSYPRFPTPPTSYKLVASRSTNKQENNEPEPTSNDRPSPLKRLLIRLAVDPEDSKRIQEATSIIKGLESALQPLADGPEISVRLTDKTYGFDPRPTGNHWDEGAIDFADDR